MAEHANQTVYRQELIKTFERRNSVLEPRVVTDGIPSGSSYVFLVNGSGDASAVTRGHNGRIPSRANQDTQLTCTMSEWHDKPQSTRFNIFSGQAGAKRRGAMQEESISVLNRKKDDLIIDALEGSTQYAGLTATTLTAEKALHARNVILRENAEVNANDVTGLISPAGETYLLQVKEITSRDYVDNTMLPSAPISFRWAGILWIVHNGVPGVGTSSERLFVFHRNAIGLAKDMENMNIAAGYNEEDDYYFARASMFMGAKLLQNDGVCSIRHDGSAYEATA
jgi:Phage capsid protein